MPNRPLKIKICGMKHNAAEVASLQPDYLGFIFYEESPRNFDLPKTPTTHPDTKKVGVFVNATVSNVLKNVRHFELHIVQLHGEERPEYIKELKKKAKHESIHFEIWNVFSIKGSFDFTELHPFEAIVDAFLFDTKGKAKGGNGYTFDWTVLKNYESTVPFILSGGIGLPEVPAILELLKTELPLMAIDVNSKFEDRPGLKDIQKLETFRKKLNTTT